MKMTAEPRKEEAAVQDDAKTRLFDTHAHLDMLKDPDEAVRRAKAAGVDYVVVPSTEPAGFDRVASLTSKHDGVFAAVGVHPHEATAWDDRAEERMRTLLEDERVVAVGEIGLDYYRNLSPRDVQIRVFARQLEIAAEAGLPVIVHNRNADEEVIAVLRDFAPPLRGVAHCFGSDAETAEKLLELGFFISFAGNITYTKSERMIQAARSIPEKRLLIETDCPYLTPVPYRGKPNEPAMLPYTAAALARIRKTPVEHLAATCTAAAMDLFGIDETLRALS